MSVVLTGVFVSEEDRIEARIRSKAAKNAPVMKVANFWVHEEASEAFVDYLDKLAVKYGLPEPGRIDGEVNHYGLTAKGEFSRYEP